MRYADCYVSEKAIIGKNVSIGKGAIIYDNVEIGDNCFIGPYAIIGEPTMDYYKNPDHEFQKTTIGRNSIIRANTTIYEDVVCGDHIQTGNNALIRAKSIVGNHTSIGSNSELFGDLRVGSYVRIHSSVIIGERTLIDDYVWIFPFVVVTNSKYPPHGFLDTAHIHEYAQIFAHAVILPGISIGKNSIIGAGALVTKDVDEECLAIGNPAKIIKKVAELKDDNGNQVYPWRDYLKEYRGYPWQDNPEQ